MIRLNLSEPLYREIEKLLPDICPDVKFSLETVDDNLTALGFCDTPPCVVAFNLNDIEFKEMLFELSNWRLMRSTLQTAKIQRKMTLTI